MVTPCNVLIDINLVNSTRKWIFVCRLKIYMKLKGLAQHERLHHKSPFNILHSIRIECHYPNRVTQII